VHRIHLRGRLERRHECSYQHDLQQDIREAIFQLAGFAVEALYGPRIARKSRLTTVASWMQVTLPP